MKDGPVAKSFYAAQGVVRENRGLAAQSDRKKPDIPASADKFGQREGPQRIGLTFQRALQKRKVIHEDSSKGATGG